MSPNPSEALTPLKAGKLRRHTTKGGDDQQGVGHFIAVSRSV